MEFDLVMALLWYLVLLFSLTFHEAAHAWAAQRGGDLTAYHAGQVSLDPRPHIRREPFGTIFMPILSFALFGYMFGWASTPYDPSWAERYPRRAAWMSLAGPAANLLLVVTAGLAIRMGISAGVLFFPEYVGFSHVVSSTVPGLWSTLATLLSITFVLNLLLFVFNLIPVPPLDGSGVVGLFLSDENARKLQGVMRQPQFSLFGLLAAWFLIRSVFPPAFDLALRLLYPEIL